MIDHGPTLGDGRPPVDGGYADETLLFVPFVVEGHDYVLVKYSDWLRDQETRPRASQGARQVVGRILNDGERHVIMESLAGPGQESDLPKLELGDLLTHRELQVALLVAEGNCDKQIARK